VHEEEGRKSDQFLTSTAVPRDVLKSPVSAGRPLSPLGQIAKKLQPFHQVRLAADSGSSDPNGKTAFEADPGAETHCRREDHEELVGGQQITAY